MSHTFLVDTVLEREDSELNEPLLPGDVIRGYEFELIFSIQNIGDEMFPGGEFSCSLEFPNTKSRADFPSEIPELQPGEHELKTFEFDAVETGRVGVNVSAKSNDNDRVKILASDSEDNEPREGWIFTLYCVDRERLMILDELRDNRHSKSSEERPEE